MEILTEFDELQNAMSKINLDESVFPYYNGRLCDDKSYNKIQKILNCPEMVSCHKYLYNLDLDQLNEDEIDKVEKLYKLGCDRGFIVDDLTDWDAENPVDVEVDGIVNPNNDKTNSADQKTAENKPISGSLFKAKIPCWTIIYSATSKDGQIKTGEAYSNAISAAAAKADVKSKLSNIGYSNITILAIESCEADVETTSFESNDYTDSDAIVGIQEADDESSDENKEDENDDESSDDESSDENDDESSDENKEDENDDESSDDESSDENDDESSDENKEDENDDESSDDESSDENKEDENDDESSDDESSDENDEDEDEDKEELDANQKAELKNKYKKTFKNTLIKCKFTKSFNDLSLDEKVKFFTQLSKAWTKNEPNEFMTDKEIEQLNNIVINSDEDED